MRAVTELENVRLTRAVIFNSVCAYDIVISTDRVEAYYASIYQVIEKRGLVNTGILLIFIQAHL